MSEQKNEQKVSNNTNKNYFFLFFLFFISLTMTIPYKIADVKRSGTAQTSSANGISINFLNRFILVPISKQMEAISCKIFTFFISNHLFKCIIPYFSRKFKCFPKSRIPITPKACISSAACLRYIINKKCCISSSRSSYSLR